MEYKKTTNIQRKGANSNKVGKKAVQLKDNRSLISKTAQLIGLEEEEDTQLKSKTTQKMGLDEEDELPMQMKSNSVEGEVAQLGKKDKYKKNTQDYVDEYYDELEDEMTGEDVYYEWNPSSAWESAIANPTPRAAWDYNVTLQWDVYGWKLRAHVHYYNNGNGTYRKVRGNGWVSGIDDFEFPTPQSVVNKAPADPTTV